MSKLQIKKELIKKIIQNTNLDYQWLTILDLKK